MRKYYVIGGEKVKTINGEGRKKSNNQKENEKKGKNYLIYKIFHWNAEEMQITK